MKGSMVQDHVHMLISIPPKYSVAEVVGYIKGKSAIAVARQFGNKKKNFNGEQFWARGYAVSTVGFEEGQISLYIEEILKQSGVSYITDMLADGGYDSHKMYEELEKKKITPVIPPPSQAVINNTAIINSLFLFL